MKKKTTTLYCKLVALYFGSFLVTVLPVAILLVLNWEKYTGYTVGGNIRLGAGAIIALAIVALKLLGKLRMPRRVVLFAIVCGLSYLLAPLLNDLFILSAAALVGEFVDWAFFQTGIRKVREQIATEQSSDVTADKMDEVLKKYMNREDEDERKA